MRRYTATDIPALIPLLRKNLASTFAPPTSGAIASTAAVTAAALDWTLPPQRQIDICDDPLDVLLVVAELRAEDVLREFLHGWIELGWSIWSVAEHLLGPRWGMWVAWRES